MLLNELAQWAALLFLGVFVFGLTRQLGLFLVPKRQELLETGPGIGEVLPAFLVEEGRGATLTRLIRRSTGAKLAAIVVIEEDCPACNGLLARMETQKVNVGMPMVALFKGELDAEFGRRVQAAFAAVIEDRAGDLSGRAGIEGTPFLLIVDEGLVVRHKDWGGDLVEAAANWLTTRADGNGAAGPARRRPAVHGAHN